MSSWSSIVPNTMTEQMRQIHEETLYIWPALFPLNSWLVLQTQLKLNVAWPVFSIVLLQKMMYTWCTTTFNHCHTDTPRCYFYLHLLSLHPLETSHQYQWLSDINMTIDSSKVVLTASLGWGESFVGYYIGVIASRVKFLPTLI